MAKGQFICIFRFVYHGLFPLYWKCTLLHISTFNNYVLLPKLRNAKCNIFHVSIKVAMFPLCVSSTKAQWIPSLPSGFMAITAKDPSKCKYKFIFHFFSFLWSHGNNKQKHWRNITFFLKSWTLLRSFIYNDSLSNLFLGPSAYIFCYCQVWIYPK